MKLPKHLRENRERLRVLRREANAIRGLFGCPVYLCGSALLDGNSEPRDWDLRIEMPDDQFVLRFCGGRGGKLRGDGRYNAIWEWEDATTTGKWGSSRWRWSDVCVKQSLHAARSTGLNIDFQIYPKSHCIIYRGRPKLRLDTRVGAGRVS